MSITPEEPHPNDFAHHPVAKLRLVQRLNNARQCSTQQSYCDDKHRIARSRGTGTVMLTDSTEVARAMSCEPTCKKTPRTANCRRFTGHPPKSCGAHRPEKS